MGARPRSPGSPSGAEPGSPCPLCGAVLGAGAPLAVLGRHFQSCTKTDDRQAPRREWHDGDKATGPDAGPSERQPR